LWGRFSTCGRFSIGLFANARIVGRRVLNLALIACVALISSIHAADQPPPIRRAVVVGIDKYDTGRLAATRIATPLVARPWKLSGAARRSTYPDLSGSVNDATAFAALLSAYDFAPNHIAVLLNEKATAQSILDTIQRELIDAAQPGDIGVFFYAGHGSTIRNSATGRNDETIVPYDAPDGVADIRDKELVRLYARAARKGVYLTAIADSCHSGGLSRGARTFSASRALDPDPRSVDDPGERDSSNRPILVTQKSADIRVPVLVLAAAGEEEEAREDVYDDQPHGAFTAAVLQAMQSAPKRESSGQLFNGIASLVRARGFKQHPIIEGEGRLDADLFGQPADSTTGMVVSVSGILPDGSIRLNAGPVAGLYPECELIRTSPASPELRTSPELRIRVKSQNGLSESFAETISGDSATVRAGQHFRLDHWVVPQSNALRLYFANDGPPVEELRKAAAAVMQLDGVQIVNDPTVENPTHQLWWQKGQWMLASGRERKGKALGRTLDPAELHRLLGSTATLFVNYPMPAKSAAALALGQGTANDSVVVERDPFSPDYVLAGRWTGDRFQYAWVRPGVLAVDQDKINLPVRTEWIPERDEGSPLQPQPQAELQAAALRLNRVKGWLTLRPPAGGDQVFPYHLALRKVGSAEFRRDGRTIEGEQYKVFLTASPHDIAEATKTGDIEQRWVYVVSIDNKGCIGRVIPITDGNVGNHLPPEGEHPETIEVTERPWDLRIRDPFGLDTYIMLVSEEQIDPKALPSTCAVRSRGVVRGNALTNLIGTIGAGTRGSGTPDSVPTTWTVDSISFLSVAKGQ
jgi:hypothetical protein